MDVLNKKYKCITRKKYVNKNTNMITFEYYDMTNEKIKDKNILQEVQKIYIAPAYTNVKIYLGKNIEATGIDTKGRKQYVYSANSKKKRETRKYCQLVILSEHIIKLKKQIQKDLLSKKMTKKKMIALILKIMDLCNFRGGNKKYEKEYGSHGLTTLHKKHVRFLRNEIEIDFIGKKGVQNKCVIQNKIVQDIIKEIYQISNKSNPYLFSMYDKKIKNYISISILDLNEYLKEYNITTKDLRTWNANIIFLKNMNQIIEDIKGMKEKEEKINIEKITHRKKMIRKAIQKTAEALHNTPSICKSSYIYKKIIEMFENNKNHIFKKIIKKDISFEALLSNLLEKNKNKNRCNDKN